MVSVRNNWRVFLLVLILLGALFALFSPTLGGATGAGAAGTAGTGTDFTNLKYGLQLSGGTRIRAPLVGVTAEGVQFGSAQPRDVEHKVAGQLPGVDPTDVIARYSTNRTGTVEVTAANASVSDLQSALNAAGYSYNNVRQGVTAQTRAETVRVLRSKINEAGLSGGTVQQVTSSTGDHFVLIQVPNENRSDVVDLVNSRGSVRVDVYYPSSQNGSKAYTTKEAVLTQDDFEQISPAQQGQNGRPPYVPVAVKGSVASSFQKTMVQTGIAQKGGSDCYYNYDHPKNSTGRCLLIVQDGQVVNAFGMSPGLADSMRSGQWQKDPQFILQTRNFSEAQQVAINLRAGALPTNLKLGGPNGGTSTYVSPTQGQSFKTDSLLTGIIAVFAVSGVVFVRYRDTRVAVPMIVTALSEVLILLGLAAAIGYAVNLSVIAGFIAVIGTGVDDLIIIADEVMSQGDVRSHRVFQSRFRKAFWVIGGAAATTIIAMSPLAVLSLGDLQGFAIFTILGVLVGVLLTRPAYGDILRILLTRGN